MTPPPFRLTDERHAEIRDHARAAFELAHAERGRTRSRLSRVPAFALAGGVIVYLAWFLAVARGLL